MIKINSAMNTLTGASSINIEYVERGINLTIPLSDPILFRGFADLDDEFKNMLASQIYNYRICVPLRLRCIYENVKFPIYGGFYMQNDVLHHVNENTQSIATFTKDQFDPMDEKYHLFNSYTSTMDEINIIDKETGIKWYIYYDNIITKIPQYDQNLIMKFLEEETAHISGLMKNPPNELFSYQDTVAIKYGVSLQTEWGLRHEDHVTARLFIPGFGADINGSMTAFYIVKKFINEHPDFVSNGDLFNLVTRYKKYHEIVTPPIFIEPYKEVINKQVYDYFVNMHKELGTDEIYSKQFSCLECRAYYNALLETCNGKIQDYEHKHYPTYTRYRRILQTMKIRQIIRESHRIRYGSGANANTNKKLMRKDIMEYYHIFIKPLFCKGE